MAVIDNAGLQELRCPLAPAQGVHAVIQGSYGEVGNLELVVPDPLDGLWVYWRNNDAHDIRPGAVAGGWSAGLRFAQGARYGTVSVLQTRHGPNNIEVIAISNAAAHRIFWNPETGFSSADCVGTTQTVAASLFEDDRPPHDLIMVSTDGDQVAVQYGESKSYPRLHFANRRYPELRWDDSPQVPPKHPISGISAVQSGGRTWISTITAGTVSVVEALPDAADERLPVDACANPVLLASTAGSALELVVGHAEGGLVSLARTTDGHWRETARFGTNLGCVDAVAACRSNLHGGQIEIVARLGERLHHCVLPKAGSSSVTISPIETHAWVAKDRAHAPQQGEPCHS